MSNSALMDRLSADLTPVRRRSPARELSMIAGIGAIELGMVAGAGLMRPDMESMIGSPYMIWKLGTLAALAAAGSALAVRSFVPTISPRKGVSILAALALLAMAIGVAGISPPQGAMTLVGRLAPRYGVICSISIIGLSMPIMAALGWLMRRAAPGYPRQSAAACGLAAGALGALVFALCCRFNDPLYIVVWYSLGVGTACAAGRWLLPRRFRL